MNVYRNRKAKIWDLEEAYQKKMQAIRDVKNRMSGESYARSLFIDKPSASSAMSKPSASSAMGKPSASSAMGKTSASSAMGKPSASSAMGKPSAFCTSVKRSESADK